MAFIRRRGPDLNGISLPMSSIRRQMVAFTLKAFDPVVNPDNSLPFVSVTLTNFASPTWVMSYVAAACADGVMNAASRHASTDSTAAAPTWTPGSTRCPPDTHKETPLASDCGRSGVLQNTIGAA